MPIDELTMIYRIALAAGLGLLVGWERERHARAAGLRTCMLVSMAGALIMSLSLHLAQLFASHGVDSVFRLDPGRLASYAIAGMGFLGAGAIIQGRLSALGVTTGAAMWACTAIGLSMGAGLYLAAAATTLFTLIALTVFSRVAKHITQEQYVSLEVEGAARGLKDHVDGLLKEYGVDVLFYGRDRCLETDKVKLNYSLKIRSGPQWAEMLAKLEELPGVSCINWRPSEVP